LEIVRGNHRCFQQTFGRKNYWDNNEVYSTYYHEEGTWICHPEEGNESDAMKGIKDTRKKCGSC
jgi:hypothetical protein